MSLVKMLFSWDCGSRFAGFLGAVVSLTVASGPAVGQISIAYTDINTADAAQFCKTLEASSNEEGPGSAALVCTGYAGIDLYLDYFDSRDAIRVGRDGVGTPFLPQFTSFGPKAEWRLEAGVPVAMILRMQLGGSTPGNWLTVHKVDATAKKGCVMGYVDARANRNANLLARDIAAGADSFVCGRSELQFLGTQGELMASLLPRLIDAAASAAPTNAVETNDTSQPQTAVGGQSNGPPALDLASIAPQNCRQGKPEGFIGGVPFQLCVIEELVNLHVIRAGDQTIVGVGSLPQPIAAFPFPVEVSDDVALVLTPQGTAWGAIVTYKVTPPEAAPFEGWSLIKAATDDVKSCAVVFGEGAVSDAVLSDVARYMEGDFVACGRGEAIWSGSSTEGFTLMMRLMNVKFAA
ncbi:MAG: hypothetical protein AAGI12_11090 [Pseudomonadota bacterium]